jgi:hypothetical protein
MPDVERIADPSLFFDLSWLPDPARGARAQDPFYVEYGRRLRAQACRRLADLTPQNFATLLWLTESQRDLPDEGGVTGDQAGCVMDVANRVLGGVYGAFELVFEGDPDPYDPRLLGVSAADLIEVLLLAMDNPTGRAMHAAVAREAGRPAQDRGGRPEV